MTTFLAFIGILALLYFAKFIYDVYLTDRHEKDWNNFRKNDPETAARIERNRGLNISKKSSSNQYDKDESLLRMARNMNCSPDEVKEEFLTNLRNNGVGEEEKNELMQTLREKKYEESKIFKIDPDDTAAAYMEKWAIEYYSSLNQSSTNAKFKEFENLKSDQEEEFLFEIDKQKKKKIISKICSDLSFSQKKSICNFLYIVAISGEDGNRNFIINKFEYPKVLYSVFQTSKRECLEDFNTIGADQYYIELRNLNKIQKEFLVFASFKIYTFQDEVNSERLKKALSQFKTIGISPDDVGRIYEDTNCSFQYFVDKTSSSNDEFFFDDDLPF